MRVERLKKVPEKAAGLGPRAFVLVLLIPEKLGVRFQTGSQTCRQNDCHQKPTRTSHDTKHVDHLVIRNIDCNGSPVRHSDESESWELPE
jgi:hypothetical protein